MSEYRREICHEAKVVANYFNTFFTGIASTLVNKLPSCLDELPARFIKDGANVL